jgi:glycosyltransferase involved in cell wall biosynthesis
MGGVATHFEQLKESFDYQIVPLRESSYGLADNFADIAATNLMARQIGMATEAMGLNPNEFDLIHAYDASVAMAALAIRDQIKKPLVATLQLSIAHLLKYYKPEIQASLMPMVSAEVHMMLQADAVIHVSAEYLRAYGHLNQNSFLIPNSIDLEKWVPTAAWSGPGREGAFRIGYIGRYAEMKNIPQLLAAELPENVDLYFVGDSSGGGGNYFDLMLHACQNLPNRHYLGKLLGQEKINWFHGMDAIVVPSTHEPFGIVCLEALASGCRLMSSFESGMASYLSSDVAFHCGTSHESIGQAFAKVQDWQPDKPKVRELLETFNPYAVRQLTSEVYHSVVSPP